jgi:hypothetical protein
LSNPPISKVTGEREEKEREKRSREEKISHID